MATYKIQWKPSALKELRRLDHKIVPRIVHAIESLTKNPFPAGVKKLAATTHTYRIREGDYRIIYSIEESILLIEVVRVGHRKDVYRK